MNLFFTLYPSRILWVGGSILFLCSFAFLFFLSPMRDFPIYSSYIGGLKQEGEKRVPELQLHQNQEDPFVMPSIEKDLSFYVSPPQPGKEVDLEHPLVALCLNKREKIRWVKLPSRVWLSFNDLGALEFEEQEGPFWVDLSLQDANTIFGKMTVLGFGGERSSFFSRLVEQPSVQKAEEFAFGSALRILGEARWLGKDLVSSVGLQKELQRIELGSNKINLSQEDYLVWKEGTWVKERDFLTGPIARIHSISAKQLEWDVWDEQGLYRRVAHPIYQDPAISLPNGAELIHSVRIRSDHQINVVLENQTLLLRLGDWVLYQQGRWRVVRTNEEREKLISGQLVGNLLIIEKIDGKKKTMQARFIHADRTRAIPFECAAPNLLVKRETKQKR